MLLFASSITIF